MNARTGTTWLMLATLVVVTLVLSARFYNHSNANVGNGQNYTPEALDLRKECLRQSIEDTARFINQHMSKTKTFTSKFDMLEFSMSQVPAELQTGLYCELGVYKGETVNFIASKTKNTVHGFDSFEGLPEDWRSRY